MDCFRPLTGISLFLSGTALNAIMTRLAVFVPSRGFLFFYKKRMSWSKKDTKFSSPHGDFSFSIFISDFFYLHLFHRFRPLTGISLFLLNLTAFSSMTTSFSSPHGDFSFSILSHIPLINQGLFL